MFSFFKSDKEKKLEKLGYQSLIQSYKQKVSNKEWTRNEYRQAMNQLYKEKKTAADNAENVNVATCQSFKEDEVMVPLNLQNILQESVDYNFIYSSLIFEYSNYKRVHPKALYELERHLDELFPDTQTSEESIQELQQLDLKTLIDKALLPITMENREYLKAVFQVLKKKIAS